MLTAFALCRFLAYAASFLLFGANAMLALCGSQSLSLSAGAALRGPMRAAAVAGALAVLCLLPLQAAAIAEDWGAMTDAGVLGAVAFQTRYGWAWCLRMAAALLVLFFVLHPRASSRAKAYAAGMALLPLGLSGHAAMQEGWMGAAHAANDMLHSLAAGFWLGSLPVFLLFLKLCREPARTLDATRALMRFSGVGHVAVAILLMSGVANAALILQGGTPDDASRYQQLLLLKILLALAMVMLAVVNRYRWIPRIRHEREAALLHIRRNAVREMAAGGFILLVVSFLGLLPPG